MKYIKGYTLYLIMLGLFFGTYGVKAAEASPPPSITAEAAILMDAKTGQVLWGKNIDQRQYPASITKVMTGMLALERGNLTDIITMSNEAVFSIGRSSSHIALDVDEELTLEQALYALAIASANDAANGIAEHISGSLENFARLMTERARDAGARQTNFVNAHGLPHKEHYTTAYDMAKIMAEAIKIPGFTEIFSAASYEIPPTNKQPETRHLNSRNPLLNSITRYEGVSAIKSGWTSQANHTLITAATQGERSLVVVVMNNQSRDSNYQDTIKLLDYGFDSFHEVKLEFKDLKATLPGFKLYIEEGNQVILLHKSLTPDDLEINYNFLERHSDTLQVVVSLNLKEPQQTMYPHLGSVFMVGGKVALNIPEEEIMVANEYTVAGADGKISSYYLPAGFLGLICLLRIHVILKSKLFGKKHRRRLCHKYRYY